MPTFEPKKETGNGQESESIPSGEYGLALVWFKRKQSDRTGNDYLSCKIEVTDGPLLGKTFFTTMSVDISKNGARVRWSLLSDSCGVTEGFEIGATKEGTAREGDENIARLFKNKPFRAVVSSVQNGEYTNNEIDKFIYPSRWTADQKREMAIWETNLQEERGNFGAPPDDAPAGVDDALDGEFDSFDIDNF